MTKEECLKALETLQDKYLNLDVVDELICFKSLIEENFDNPPLRFGQLRTNLKVFDKFLNEWILIGILHGKHILNHTVPYFRFGDKELYIVDFEENRFYKKQVKE